MLKFKNGLGNRYGDLTNYFDGFDLYNSVLLEYLQDAYESRQKYEIRTFEYRPDLIAKDIYGDASYAGILLLVCGVGIESLSKGSIIEIIPKVTLDGIFQKLQRYN